MTRLARALWVLKVAAAELGPDRTELQFLHGLGANEAAKTESA